MKVLNTCQFVDIPEDVTVTTNARSVTVTGPRGSISQSFKHTSLDIQTVDNGRRVRVELWLGKRKQVACVKTVVSHIRNMVTGVTKGFNYKLRFVYAHFPINVTLNDRTVEIRNYIGERRVRTVELLDGVEYTRTDNVKDQIEITGNDIRSVSLTAARIQQATTVRDKDIRKFLDGIYVSEKGHIVEEEA